MELGVRRVATIRRVASHRRGAEGLQGTRVFLGHGFPTQECRRGNIASGSWPKKRGLQTHCHENRIHKLALRREAFLSHRFPDQCTGRQASLTGTSLQATSQACCGRMRAAIAWASAGQRHIQIHTDKENARLACQAAHQVSQAPASWSLGSGQSGLVRLSRPEGGGEASSAKRVRTAPGGAQHSHSSQGPPGHRVSSSDGQPSSRPARLRAGP